MRKENVLCFDIETTGNSPLRDEILQLTVVNGNRQIMFNEYFRPRWIKDWENPVITPANAAQRQTFSQSSTQLQRLLCNADLIVGYNCERYSLAFLEQAGLSVPVPSFDVMREYSALYGLNEFLPLRDCCVHYGQDHYNWLLCFDGLIRDGGWTVTPTEIHPPAVGDGKHLIMSNGTRDFAVRTENAPSEKPIPTKHNTGMKL